MKRVTGDETTGGPAVDLETKRRRVRLLVTIVLVGTVTAIAYHYVAAYYLGRGYPVSTFLFEPPDHFGDWYKTYGYAATFVTGSFEAPFVYFPFGYLTIVLATWLPATVGFVVVVLAFLAAMFTALGKWVVDCEQHTLVKVQYAFVLVALSYPVIFALDRANLDLLLFALVAGFFYFCYVRRSLWLAALFLGAAIAFKFYPATLLLLPLAERRFKLAAACVAAAGGLSLAAAAALSAISGHTLFQVAYMCLAEKRGYQGFSVVDGYGLQHGHTLWGLLRLPGFALHLDVARWQTQSYMAVSALLFVVVAAYVVFWERELWKRVLLVVLPLLLLPFVSADYALLYLYFPLFFYLNEPRVSRWDRAYVCLFAVLLIPVDYYYLSGDFGGVSVSVAVYPLAMLGLLALALVDRRRSPGGAEGTLPGPD